jgi:capsular exopolysaccharide synthesis family protein
MTQQPSTPPSGFPAPRKAKKGKMPAELWSNFGEEFRSLRTRLAAMLDQRHKVLLMTSALPQEGKTTSSVALARSFAQMEWRTILVDCDLRKPTLHTLFGTDRFPGLTDVLQGRVREEDAISATDNLHLDLLSAGSQIPGPAELLHTAATEALLKRLGARYDYVVVDSPPLISITDTLLLSGYVDGILMVVNGRVSPRELVKTARDQLQDRPVLGVVLNGISTPKKYGYYY